jgi:hypothetical protein
MTRVKELADSKKPCYQYKPEMTLHFHRYAVCLSTYLVIMEPIFTDTCEMMITALEMC